MGSITIKPMRDNKTKLGLLSLAIAMLAAPMQAQDLKISVNHKGKVGFADKDGRVVIKHSYDSATPFSNGISIVTKSGKSGMIDTTGKVLLPLKYSQISSWTSNAYLVKSGKKMGLVSSHGEILLAPKYSLISKPNCYDRALVALGGKATVNSNDMYMVSYDEKPNILLGKGTYMLGAKYGVIDTMGKVLIEPKYKGLYEFAMDGKDVTQFHEGAGLKYSYHYTTDTLATNCEYMGFSTDFSSVGNAGILSDNGTIVLKNKQYNFVLQPVNGMARYYKAKGKKMICGYYDITTGKSMEVAKFDSSFKELGRWTHGDFVGDIAPVNCETSWSFFDKSGNSVRSGYSQIKRNQYIGLWAGQDDNAKWQVFDDSNKDVSTLSGYDDFFFPENKGDEEIFTIKKDGMYGCVNRSGSQVVPFAYESALGNTYDVVPVKKDGKWGLVSPSGKLLVPMEFADVYMPTERGTKDFWVMESDSLYYHYNIAAKKLSKDGYKRVANFKNGIAHVAPADMKLEDCMLNRAQLAVPNTPKSNLYALDLEQYRNAFGYLVSTDDVVLINRPVSTLYIDAVRKRIAELGHSVPTEIEKKKILLDVTRENRSYELEKPIGEEEWNY